MGKNDESKPQNHKSQRPCSSMFCIIPLVCGFETCYVSLPDVRSPSILCTVGVPSHRKFCYGVAAIEYMNPNSNPWYYYSGIAEMVWSVDGARQDLYNHRQRTTKKVLWPFWSLSFEDNFLGLHIVQRLGTSQFRFSITNGEA